MLMLGTWVQRMGWGDKALTSAAGETQPLCDCDLWRWDVAPGCKSHARCWQRFWGRMRCCKILAASEPPQIQTEHLNAQKKHSRVIPGPNLAFARTGMSLKAFVHDKSRILDTSCRECCDCGLASPLFPSVCHLLTHTCVLTIVHRLDAQRNRCVRLSLGEQDDFQCFRMDLLSSHQLLGRP